MAGLAGHRMVQVRQAQPGRHRHRHGGGPGQHHPGLGLRRPLGGLVIGLAGGALCYLAVDWVKHRFKIDDSLDVFAVHGVGGLLGTLLLAVLMAEGLGGAGYGEGGSLGGQLWVQLVGVLAVGAWTLIATFAIVMVVKALVGLRVEKDEEIEGLDYAAHGESGYNF